MVGEAIEDCDDTDAICLTGVCQTLVCTANAYYCAGKQRRLCNSLGTGSSAIQTCSARCSSGVCTTCSGTSFCQGDALYNCNGGSSSTLQRTCSEGCIEAGSTAHCGEDELPDGGLPDAG
jgi:hypothetical protein